MCHAYRHRDDASAVLTITVETNGGGIVTSYDVLCENLWNQLGAIVGEDTGNRTRTQYTEVYRDIAESRLYFCESSARSILCKMVTVNVLVKNIWNRRLSRNRYIYRIDSCSKIKEKGIEVLCYEFY